MNMLRYVMGAVLCTVAITVFGGCTGSRSWNHRSSRGTLPSPSTTPNQSDPLISDPSGSIYSTTPSALHNPGKIYVRDNYLFISERGGGVHVIDNSSPSNPRNISYIVVPGNSDVAVKGTIMYADNRGDLAVIDISDPRNARLVKRVPAVFPAAAMSGSRQQTAASGGSSTRNVWEEWINDRRLKTYGTVGINGTTNNLTTSSTATTTTTSSISSTSSTSSSSSSSSSSQSGKGGSMARLTIVGNYLYAVTSTDLKIFNIMDQSNPSYNASESVGTGIETIFPYRNKLFIGSQMGMFIYDNSNPNNPQREGAFTHARSCDPVVADDNYAYVTLRGGGPCGGTMNQMDVLDIRDVFHPKLIRSYQMTQPYGVAVDGRTLYVCDGKAGLKVYDATNPSNLILRQQITSVYPYDVIPYRNTAIVSASGGLYQYDCTQLDQIRLLSVIPVN